MTEIEIAAVGDLLMKREIIDSAKLPGENKYSFDAMFKEVAPYLKSADLTIGNLETTFSGEDLNNGSNMTKEGYPKTNCPNERRNPKTGYPLFSCPDELASTLKKVGFDVLTTANNHCMDRGVTGLRRTIKILDKHGIAHTGTYCSNKESKNYCIKDVKGIKIGILAYTMGTNSIPLPKDKSWLVNRIRSQKIIFDIRQLKSKVDLIIVCLHFGQEYHHYPNQKQKKVVEILFKNGADVILGTHSHVVQSMIYKKGKFAIYSLGNFISTRLKNNDHTVSGVILQLTVKKDDQGKTKISNVQYVPIWVHRIKSAGRTTFKLLPIRETLNNPSNKLTEKERKTMKKLWNRIKALQKVEPH